MTDTMYNSRMWPYVSHFAGTDRIVEHIEKYVPDDHQHGSRRPAFRSRRQAPACRLLIGEDEYKTEESLPKFAAKELERRGFRVLRLAEPKHHDFPGLARSCRHSVVSVRRAKPELKAHRPIAAGKPLVGIRTASHAFDTRGKGLPVILNGHRLIGRARRPLHRASPERCSSNDRARTRFAGPSDPCRRQHAFSKLGLALQDQSTRGYGLSPVDREGRQLPVEPVAWVNRKGPSRIFYTSLGHPGDFERPEFRRLLKNAVFWALDRQPASQTKRPASAASTNISAPPESPPF